MPGILRSVRLALVIALAATLAACGGAAAPADKAVVLTVTGAIGATNRGPLNEFNDAFLGHQGVKFDKAFEFTRAGLAALGTHELTVRRANWPAPVSVKGPRFKDVMAAVKAEGNTVLLQALDGYESKFAISALQSDEVILAIEADDAPLPIGGHGPAWLVFPANAVPGDDASGDAGLAWSIFHIEVVKD